MLWCDFGSLALGFRQFCLTVAHHHTRLIFVLLVEKGFFYVGQAGLELLTSGDTRWNKGDECDRGSLYDM